jgi:hypothetical protein
MKECEGVEILLQSYFSMELGGDEFLGLHPSCFTERERDLGAY